MMTPDEIISNAARILAQRRKGKKVDLSDKERERRRHAMHQANRMHFCEGCGQARRWKTRSKVGGVRKAVACRVCGAVRELGKTEEGK